MEFVVHKVQMGVLTVVIAWWDLEVTVMEMVTKMKAAKVTAS